LYIVFNPGLFSISIEEQKRATQRTGGKSPPCTDIELIVKFNSISWL
jgi:hypothetical protein